jgi:hypothetical protein
MSVDEHHQAVFSEPLTATTNPDLLLAGVAESDTGGRAATLPDFLFYVRSSSRNGISGRWPGAPIAAISVEMGGVRRQRSEAGSKKRITS